MTYARALGRAQITTAVFICAATCLLAFAASAFAVVAPQISPNYEQACGLVDTGAVKCWGETGDGQLGNGDISGTDSAPVDVTGITNAVSLAAGDESNCALLATGSVKCWGDDSSGELGNDVATTDSALPVDVAGITTAVSLAGSDYHYCVVLADTSVQCWGSNVTGQTGGAIGPDSTTPVGVAGLTGVKQIAVANSTTCAMLTSGAVKCWGSDASEQLGDGPGPTANTNVPVGASGITNATQISGANSSFCALLATGTIKCWGGNGSYNLGLNDTTTRDVPTDVPGLASVTKVAVGWRGGCASIADGSIQCWGGNGNGEMGSGNTTAVQVPTAVPGIAGVTIFPAAFDEHMCVGFAGGGVKCWGYNDNRQAGVDPVAADVLIPADVAGVDLVTQAHAGTGQAITITGKAKADKKKKTLTLLGTVGATPSIFVPAAEACSGTIGVLATWTYTVTKKGKKNKKTGKRKNKKVKKTGTTKTTAPSTLSGATCVANFTLKFPVKTANAAKVGITANFAGNTALAAFGVANQTVKLPKVKPAKKPKKKKKKGN
ncbi:MAG TPA: hypothetical protein VGO97_05490 [Solirubrobacterales bacterium]|nr:hypothetical protein [Solirubrobacterales bacterium]